MLDERDVSPERKWLYAERSKTVMSNLARRNMEGYYVQDRNEALPLLMGMIPAGIGVLEFWSNGMRRPRSGHPVFHHSDTPLLLPAFYAFVICGPSGVSLTTYCFAASSSRMRSEVAKSLSLRAFSRSSTMA